MAKVAGTGCDAHQFQTPAKAGVANRGQSWRNKVAVGHGNWMESERERQRNAALRSPTTKSGLQTSRAGKMHNEAAISSVDASSSLELLQMGDYSLPLGVL